MNTTEKITMLVDGHAIPEPHECFAVPGADWMIDCINPATGRTAIYGKTLEDCRQDPDYAGAERMTIDEFCRSKAALQDVPITWTETTEDRFDEMFEVLPPAYYHDSGFLVGEPYDHHAMTGRPRYQAYRRVGTRYEVANRPMTIQEFRIL